MMYTLQTREPQCTPPKDVKHCPFCGTDMIWHETKPDWGTEWSLSFVHPGVVTDKDCILCGLSFHPEDLARWNTRYE